MLVQPCSHAARRGKLALIDKHWESSFWEDGDMQAALGLTLFNLLNLLFLMLVYFTFDLLLTLPSASKRTKVSTFCLVNTCITIFRADHSGRAA
jgi:hypothetical protein